MASFPDSLRLENLRVWDHGLVAQALSQSHVVPRALSATQKDAAMGQIVPATPPKKHLSVGTFSGTAKALTEVFRAGESRSGIIHLPSIYSLLTAMTQIPLFLRRTRD